MKTDLMAASVVCRECGGLDALDHVVSTISAFLDTSRPWTLEASAAKGYASLVRRILWTTYGPAPAQVDKTDKTFSRAMEKAATIGHLETIVTLLQWHPSCRVSSAMEEAAANGHLSVVQFLHLQSTSADRMTLDAMDSAAVNGHLEMVQWLHTNRSEGCTTRAMDGAARAGRLDIVKWLHANRREGCTTQAMDGAAANGKLDVVEWLHLNRHEGCSSIAGIAARAKGHAHVVQWLERMQSHPVKPLLPWHERKARAEVVTWRQPHAPSLPVS